MYQHNIIPDRSLAVLRTQTEEWTSKALAKSLNTGEMTLMEQSREIRAPRNRTEQAGQQFEDRVNFRNRMAKSLMRKQYSEQHPGNPKHGGSDMRKAGLTTFVGYNFIDLRGPAVLAYPVNTPIRNEMSRNGAVNAGVGTYAEWKTNRNPGYAYGGVPQGLRAQIGTPDETNYFATYASIGHERSVSFEAQWAGEGYTDNMADEHLRGLNVIFLQEESIMLLGNSGIGSGYNGFAINGVGGSTPTATPTVAAIATTTTVATLVPGGYQCVTGITGSVVYQCLPFTSAFSGTSTYYVAVVVLTAMGNPSNQQYGYLPPTATPSIANGLTPSYTYSAPGTGTTVTVFGGMSAISPIGSGAVSSGNLTLTASITPYKGAFGYAWYVGTSNSLGALSLAGITTSATAVLSGTATGTQLATAAGLNTDHSYQQGSATNAGDFDGLLTFAATSGYWQDLGGLSLTSQKNGRITQIENMLEYLFVNYQVQPTRFWVSPDVATSLDEAVRYSGLGTGGSFSGLQFVYTRDGQNNVLGGFVVSGYQTRFAVQNPTGGNVIPVSVHPMMPTGTLFADFEQNPYPASRAPFSRGMYIQKDYYGIEWPLTSRQWTWGVYSNETLAHYFGWLACCITGVGPWVNS